MYQNKSTISLTCGSPALSCLGKQCPLKKKTSQQKSQCCMVLPPTRVCLLALGLFTGISSGSKVSMCHFLLTTASSTSPPLHGLSWAMSMASSITCCCQACPASIFAIILCCSHATSRQKEKPKMEKRKMIDALGPGASVVCWLGGAVIVAVRVAVALILARPGAFFKM